MVDPELVRFAADGRALIVAVVHPDGRPHATRGWGLRAEDDGTLRLLLDAHDLEGNACLVAGAPVAVTAADVPTLQSVQIKGHARDVVAPEPEDLAAVERFVDAFFTAIVETDGTDRRVLERIVPEAYVVCRLRAAAVYDQTPGPGAGAAVGSP